MQSSKNLFAEASEAGFARFGIIFKNDAVAINILLLCGENTPFTFRGLVEFASGHTRPKYKAEQSRPEAMPILSSAPSA